MLAYMNEESLKLTIETGYAHYFSRSRKELWKKVRLQKFTRSKGFILIVIGIHCP